MLLQSAYSVALLTMTSRNYAIIMPEFNLQKLLKSLLFSSSEPLSVKDIQAVVSRFHKALESPLSNEQKAIQGLEQQVPTLLTAAQIREAMAGIKQNLLENNEVYRLVHGAAGYRLMIAPDYAVWVRFLRGQLRPIKLSNAMMETLAIVAYRQPITRAEMEAIRGVAVSNAITRLLEYGFIYSVGHVDLPGRPLLYETTDKFLDFVGIRSLEELPASDVLKPQQLKRWLDQAIQQHDGRLSDGGVGLPTTGNDL